LKKRDREPVFGEPWHAQALAMADLLVETGAISRSRWNETLSHEISASEAAKEFDDPDTFFRAVLSAIQLLLAENNLVAHAEIFRRQQQWKSAYLSTPHGKPVELRRRPPSDQLPADAGRLQDLPEYQDHDRVGCDQQTGPLQVHEVSPVFRWRQPPAESVGGPRY
jgi:nitrile hydratase accessory protein